MVCPLLFEFYLRATARFGWTKAVLQHQIDNQSYQKYLLNQTNFDQALPDDIKAQAALAVKHHYTFDFLELAEAEDHAKAFDEQVYLANNTDVAAAIKAGQFDSAWGHYQQHGRLEKRGMH